MQQDVRKSMFEHMAHDGRVHEQRQIVSRSPLHRIRPPHAQFNCLAQPTASQPRQKYMLELALTAHCIASAFQVLYQKMPLIAHCATPAAKCPMRTASYSQLCHIGSPKSVNGLLHHCATRISKPTASCPSKTTASRPLPHTLLSWPLTAHCVACARQTS